MEPKVVTISIPEYILDKQPDYKTIGSKIDKAIEENFEGTFLLRALSAADHPTYSHDEFEPYKPDLQAGEIIINNGKIIGESFGEDIRRFYENTLLDRGYRVRID